MTRKWERMVRKNTKTANQYRSKQGVPPISDPNRTQVFKGRSTILTLFLIGVSLILMFTSSKTGQDSMYWFTTASYFLFGLFIYFVRRPYLKVNKNNLSKKGIARESIVTAENIKQIIIKPGHVIIELNGKPRWVYSKLLHRFDLDAIAGRLKIFSEQNQVAFVDEVKS